MINSCEILSNLNGFSIELCDENGYILSRRNKLYHVVDLKDKPLYIGQVKLSLIKTFISYFRLCQRLFRLIYYNVVRLDTDTFFVSFGRQIGFMRKGIFVPVEGLRQPTRILREGVVLATDGNIYWGEYVPNLDKQDIVIYRLSPDTMKVSTAMVFAPGQIRHVHGLYLDPYNTNDIWLTTGDAASESRILKTSDFFETCEMQWGLDESWRAVSLLFTKDSIYYGTDAEFEQNYIYKIDRKSGKRIQISEINGPCFYSKKVGRYLLFAVTAELCPSQTDTQAALYKVDLEVDSCTKIFTAEKDFVRSGKRFAKEPFLVRAFMYGTLHFARGDSFDESLYISCLGLKKYDNKVVKVAL